MENVGDRRVRRADGSTVIAATMRPDGTVRRERRVKPGFTPPDEVAAYNASQRVAARRGYGPPRVGPVGANPEPAGIPGAAAAPASRPKTKAQRKNEARRKRKQEGRLRKTQEAEAAAAAAAAASTPGGGGSGSATAAEAPAVSGEAALADKARKNIRKIKKKLRQIADIEQLAEKNTDQLKKLQTKPDLLQKLSIATAALESMAISS